MEKNLFEQIAYRGYNINIYYDSNADNPRSWSNLGTIYTAHRRYRPEKEFDKHFEIDAVFKDKIGDFRDSFLQHTIALPLYLYDHSGITVSTTPFSCPWDSGFFGIIAVDVEKVKTEYRWTKLTKRRRTQIEELLQAEVKTLDDYFTGQVYGFTITSINDEKTELDSCYGYFGEDGVKQLQEECKHFIDTHINEQCKERFAEFTENIKKIGMQINLSMPQFKIITE